MVPILPNILFLIITEIICWYSVDKSDCYHSVFNLLKSDHVTETLGQKDKLEYLMRKYCGHKHIHLVIVKNYELAVTINVFIKVNYLTAWRHICLFRPWFGVLSGTRWTDSVCRAVCYPAVHPTRELPCSHCDLVQGLPANHPGSSEYRWHCHHLRVCHDSSQDRKWRMGPVLSFSTEEWRWLVLLCGHQQCVQAQQSNIPPRSPAGCRYVISLTCRL